MTSTSVQARVDRFAADLESILEAVREVMVGQDAVLEEVLTVLLGGGHALLEGVPGTGKTLLVNAVARATGLDFNRVQFTPDLLPADILGCETLLVGDTERIEFRPGPVFTQFLLADEINRGTPRTQSALLEAMQERAVTVGGQRHPLDPLFTVFATRNPIELEGTYPLPEAQLDRFLLEVHVTPPGVDEMIEIAERTTRESEPEVPAVVTPERLLEMRQEVRHVIASETVLRHAAQLVAATQPDDDRAPSVVKEAVQYGAGVRGLQALVLAGKVRALREGRSHLAYEDLDRYLIPALRPRVILSLEGEARGTTIEQIVEVIRQDVRPEGV